MPTRRSREPLNALVLAALAVTVSAVLIAAGSGSRQSVPAGEPSWQGLAGAQRPRVAVGQRVIVVLKAPALADRVGNAGGLATGEDERRWTQTALAAQKLLIARLRIEGFVANIAHQLFEQVFDGDETCGAAVFVDDDREMRLTCLHHFEQLVGLLRLGHELRRAHDSAHRLAAAPGTFGTHHVFGVGDADNVVDVLAHYRKP